MEKINVDLIPNENDLKVIHASQNDTESRKFGFKLFSQEGYYDVPEITNIDLKYDTEAGGTETLLPVNTSTPTTTPLNAIINGDEVYFNERVSDGNKQNIEKIKGNTLVFNQLVKNGNFADTSVWIVAIPVSFTVQNNIATVTTNTDGDYNIRQLIPMIIGHKYIYFVDCWTDDNTYTEAIIFYGGASDVAKCEVPTNNTWASFSGIFTCVSNQYNFIRLRNQKIGITNKFRNVSIIDLTLMFGSGNEPTSVSDFTDLFPLPYYDYNAGSLLSFNGTGIKTENASQTESNTLSLPISTYFPTGMKSAGTVYDELTLNKAITRISEVDLGTLTWTYDSANNRFKSNAISDILSPSSASVSANAVCEKYPVLNYTNSIATDKTMTVIFQGSAAEGQLWVHDSSFTSASAFASAMSGVYLYYELKTPTEVDFMSANLICSNGVEIPLTKDGDDLYCDCTAELSANSGKFDCKIKLNNGGEVIYSALFILKVEVKP